jgi:uncharacterized membrane protein
VRGFDLCRAADILLGSLIYIPVKRILRDEMVPVDPLTVFGLSGWWPELARARSETIVAVNVGGCVNPASLASYEVLQLAHTDSVLATVAAIVLNVMVCYRLARPVRGGGILMPGLAPPLVAAFIAGTFGPLVGADLLHLRQVAQLDTGIVSIGGAGTFDGILLSGIVALYLS